MSRKDQSLKELQDRWYKRLAEDGFEDIEDTKKPGCPLKNWHSFDFGKDWLIEKARKRIVYQEEIDRFNNLPDLKDIVKIITKHGNSSFTTKQVIRIWELHIDGHTERKIAVQMKRSKTCIHGLLERIRAWMKVA